MSDDEVDIAVYVEGAIAAFGAASASMEFSTEDRARFRKVFHATLWRYLYRASEENREWVSAQIQVISRCIAAGLSFDETKEELANAAIVAGRAPGSFAHDGH